MEYSKKDRKKGGLGKINFPMVADVSHQIALNYDCIIHEGDDNGVSLRATFIIDSKGIIRHKSVGDLPVGRNIDEVLRLVQAF
jgi:alkyl hydroperoxide reductase subunit AhpC